MILTISSKKQFLRKAGVIYILVFFMLTSCKSYWANKYFDKIGVYDDKIEIEKVTKYEKEVVFIPIRHIGTQIFYENVKEKVDSLIQQNYHIYYETIVSNTIKNNVLSSKNLIMIDTLLAYKLRKISNANLISKDLKTDYIELLKVNGIKLKKDLIMQPAIKELHLSHPTCKNVDVTFENLIFAYEQKYGKITLEPCDYKTLFYEKSICNKNKFKNLFATFQLDLRNLIVVKELINNSHNKIAIVYGADHFTGIKGELLKRGFK